VGVGVPADACRRWDSGDHLCVCRSPVHHRVRLLASALRHQSPARHAAFAANDRCGVLRLARFVGFFARFVQSG